MDKNKITGHLLALFTATVWGATFISTEYLIKDGFTPSDILITRFLIGYITLWLMKPQLFKWQGIRTEALFMGSGLCGLTIYYLSENLAVQYTSAAIVGILVSVAPLFTGLLALAVMKEKIHLGFILGFVLAFSGIIIVSLKGGTEGLATSAIGCVLSIAAAFFWGIYSVLTQVAGKRGYNTTVLTRRIFFYGIVFMIPVIFIGKGFAPLYFGPDYAKMVSGTPLFHMLFLGCIASGLCFTTWNKSMKMISTMSASAYIYLVPVITMAISRVVFPEDRLTVFAVIGTLLILSGLVISERKKFRG